MLSGGLWRRGGKRKESSPLRLWNLNVCIENVDAKFSLAEMTLVMTSAPLQCCDTGMEWVREGKPYFPLFKLAKRQRRPLGQSVSTNFVANCSQ